MNIKNSLLQCCDIAILMTLRRKHANNNIKTAEIEANFNTFKQLLKDTWRFEVSTTAAADLNIKKWNKPTVLPIAKDLQHFKSYLLEISKNASQTLKENENDRTSFKLLLEAVFCQVMLLNRRRVGELERIPLHLYTTAGKRGHEEFENIMTPTEQVLLKTLKRVVTRGKRGRGVPVLFSEDTQSFIHILLKVRNNFVSINNGYLFPKLGTENPLTGYKIMAKHAKQSGVKHPEALTSTKLRKHLATLSQIFSMSSAEIEQLSTFMGHTSNIHRQVYRMPDDIYQTAKISKLLMLMEKGQAGKYKGKTLDEIEMNIDQEEIVEDANESDLEQESDHTIQNAPEESEDPWIVNTEVKVKKAKQKRVLISWTDQQKQLTKSYFKNHIKLKRPPRKGEVDKLVKDHPSVFCNKTWPQIKVFVQNMYKKDL